MSKNLPFEELFTSIKKKFDLEIDPRNKVSEYMLCKLKEKFEESRILLNMSRLSRDGTSIFPYFSFFTESEMNKMEDLFMLHKEFYHPILGFKKFKFDKYIYFAQAQNEVGQIKMGKSIDPKKRIMKELQPNWASRLEIIYIMPGNDELDEILKKRFKKYNIHHEWYEPKPIIDFINKMKKFY